MALVAPLLGTGKMQMLAQGVEQRHASVQLERRGFAVDGEADLRYRRRAYGSVARLR